MKLTFAFFVLISNLVFAQNLPLFEGQFTFREQSLKPIQARHHIMIQTFTDVAKSYLAQIRSIGYNCQPVSGATFSCKKIDSRISENSAIRQAVINKYKNSQVSFNRPTSDYVLINDSPALKEYQINQTSQLGQMKFDQLSLMILKDIVKIKLTKFNSSDVAYFNLTAEGLLGAVVQVSQNTKPSQNFISNETYTYLYELIYR